MLQRLIPAPIATPNHHQGPITLQRQRSQPILGRTGTLFMLSSHTRAIRGQLRPSEPCCCRSEARVRTRQFPHAPTPAHTKCASGFARVTTSPDVHVAVRKLRRRARTPATSISELSREKEVKGEVAGASHQGPVLLRLSEVAAETQRAPIPRTGRSQVREATTTTRAGRGVTTRAG